MTEGGDSDLCNFEDKIKDSKINLKTKCCNSYVTQ